MLSTAEFVKTNFCRRNGGTALERSFEEVLVEQCATTLAGMKPASLFRYQGAGKRQSREAAARWARELAPHGITVRVLKYCPQTGACLIYLYRAGWLRSILTEPSIRAFLAGQGYQADQDCQSLLRQLSRRLCLEREFPHEIGVFLGYPLEDVVGFIENQGRNYTCCGYWKAYGDPEAARRRFDRYRRCTAVWKERFRRGAAITQLIAA